MIIIPAIDLLGGSCVRLLRGVYDTAEKVAADPLETARLFESNGAEYIHLVDLDGAKEGSRINHNIICKITREVSVPVELGGGIRDMEAVDFYINNGVSRVILGSAAINNPMLVKEAVEKHGDKIAVGIDAKNGYASAGGWLEDSEVYFTELAVKMAAAGVDNIIFTDIERDGTLSGPPLGRLRELKEALHAGYKITASGGVKDLDDIISLKPLELYGVICGKSLYSGTLSFKEAIKAAK